jgi:endonuclease/exonuclease/phosphatase family metal-dependent hydrolase
MKLYNPSDNICILTVYRAPMVNVIHFLNILEAICNRIHIKSKNVILCGDINMNYLDDMDNNKIRMVSLLASYHLTSIVDFPTRVSNTSATANDNIFINRNVNKTFSIFPLHNGLSDHDAKLLTLGKTPF